jgi:hypothetical protein
VALPGVAMAHRKWSIFGRSRRVSSVGVGEIRANLTVGGDVSGQLTVGSHIVQMRVDTVLGNLVTVLPRDALANVAGPPGASEPCAAPTSRDVRPPPGDGTHCRGALQSTPRRTAWARGRGQVDLAAIPRAPPTGWTCVWWSSAPFRSWAVPRAGAGEQRRGAGDGGGRVGPARRRVHEQHRPLVATA